MLYEDICIIPPVVVIHVQEYNKGLNIVRYCVLLNLKQPHVF